MNKNKAHRKINFGGGGIKCPCCNPFTSVKECRTKINRALRRKLKQSSAKEVDGGDFVE
jgi:hypothetical protein